VLGSAIAHGLAHAGARVVILGRRRDNAEQRAEALRQTGAEAMVAIADVLDEAALARARDEILGAWLRVDILINAAGGSVPRARSDHKSVFEVPVDATDEVLRLNLHGTIVPTMVFGPVMAEQKSGCIINISSMAATRVLSGVLGYSLAKAAIDNFTRWMAVDVARRHSPAIRVNAVAPGFFITEQNRAVLVNADGTLTDRSRRVIEHTPMGRFGKPEELIGAVQWLCSDGAAFVTGAVIPVDGGFSLYSGV
jgi:NAD(P)-dependent dehydrogenase (short-subunit alcohol dehydrogenase family)